MVDFDATMAFVTVVEEGSFAGAARRLGLPPSSITRRVQRLEADLRGPLLQRTTRSVRMTPAGSEYYSRVRPALATLAEASAAVQADASEPRGTVRMTAPADFSITVLGPILARFSERHPEVRVELEVTQRRVDLVEEGFDLALRGGPLRDSSLVVRRLIPMASRLFASPAFVDRYGRPQHPADLERLPCVLFRARDGRSRWGLNRGSEKTAVEVRGPVSVDLMGLNRTLMLEGIGIALIPHVYCQGDVERGRAVHVLPEWEQAGHGLSLVFPPVQPTPRRVQVLRDFLIEELNVRAVRASAEATTPRPRPNASRQHSAFDDAGEPVAE